MWQPLMTASPGGWGSIKRPAKNSEWLDRTVWWTRNKVFWTERIMDPLWNKKSGCCVGGTMIPVVSESMFQKKGKPKARKKWKFLDKYIVGQACFKYFVEVTSKVHRICSIVLQDCGSSVYGTKNRINMLIDPANWMTLTGSQQVPPSHQLGSVW